MMALTAASSAIVDEIVLIDLVALFLSITTVSVLWYAVKKIFADEVRDVRFFLTFIAVIVPFVMLICFGLAVINYDAMATGSSWPQVLPLSIFSPLFFGTVVFYIGQTVWLWWGWHKLRIPR